ncbi:protein of unknown function (plasmid) [Escherichia coli]|nr:protein of unknown function [Escherichia coli]
MILTVPRPASGCDQSTLATWFRKYPEIQVVSRDRGGVYATAAREGAPQARQIADRWHLLKILAMRLNE